MAAAELGALAARAGGRERLLLVAERRAGEAPPRALLEGFARDLFAEPGAEAGGAGGGAWAGGARRWPWCPLAFVLWRPGAPARAPERERRRLRELVRDVRGRLPPGAALVAVLVREAPPEDGAPEPEEAARLRLEALLRRACARGRPPAPEALQAALYSPGSPQGAAPVRAAAVRALRAALQQLPADGVETEKPRLPAFLRCLPWGRRSQKTGGCVGKPPDNSGDDGLQEAEEGVALTNLAPNGNCEEACGGAGT